MIFFVAMNLIVNFLGMLIDYVDAHLMLGIVNYGSNVEILRMSFRYPHLAVKKSQFSMLFSLHIEDFITCIYQIKSSWFVCVIGKCLLEVRKMHKQ